MILSLANLDATVALGRTLGQRLFPGAVIALIGGLGAGKTHLTQAVAEGLGVTEGVNSPTFVLMQQYEGRLTIFHFDIYRLTSPSAFLDLGAAEVLESDGVCIVEWADRVLEHLPADRLEIRLRPTGDESREAVLTATGPRHAALLEGWPG